MEILFARDGRAFKTYHFDDNGKPYASLRQPCSRCGGAGRLEQWRFTGLTCYRCAGETFDPNRLILKLYTAEKNAVLDAAQAKRDATKATKQAEAARVEALRVEAEREEIISAHRPILKRIHQHAIPGADSSEDSAVKFLAEMRDQITVKARPLTDKQIAAATRIMDAREKEAARIAKAQFIGEIGERLEMTLTLGRVYSDLISEFPYIWSYTVYCRTDDGCTVVYKGSHWSTVGHTMLDLPGATSRDDRVFAEGRKVRIKATVKKHYTNAKGEPVTVVNRPKVIEMIAEGALPERYAA